MLNKLKNTAKHTFIYSIGNLSTKIIGLLLLPLYTAKLTLLDYGRFTILETTSMFLTMVLGLRIVSSMMRWSAGTEDKIEQGKILFNTYIVLIFTAIIINIVFSPLKDWFRIFHYALPNFQPIVVMTLVEF
jgi:O-antigen/teichoic acid export membrane protein